MFRAFEAGFAPGQLLPGSFVRRALHADGDLGTFFSVTLTRPLCNNKLMRLQLHEQGLMVNQQAFEISGLIMLDLMIVGKNAPTTVTIFTTKQLAWRILIQVLDIFQI
eukprot:m.218167 g.218167  ORF g.218167 m.218167 type:complete len:108 (-) comp33256_c1_seq3:1207-1530(-)